MPRRPSPRGSRRSGSSRRSTSRCGRPSPRRSPGRRRARRRPRRGRRRGASRPRPSDRQPEPLGHRPPQRREVAGLEREHAVAGRERVDERRLPRAGARAGVDDDRPARPEHPAQAVEDLEPERGEVRPAVVDRRRVDRAQDAVWDVRRPGICRKCRPLRWLTPGQTRVRPLGMRAHWRRELRARSAPTTTRATSTRATRACTRARRCCRVPARRRRRRRRDRAAARFGVPVSPAARARASPARRRASGLVLDTSRHMDAIGEIDVAARRVRVGPGVVQEDLNRAAAPHGLGVRPRHLDLQPGDARRHDRQQLLGQPLDRLRHDDRPRPRARRRALRRLDARASGR